MKDVMQALLVIFFFLSYQARAQYIPPIEELCGVIVDSAKQAECIRCFTEAGSVAVNPEEVRACVATYLPPVMAECSVPQARGNLDRIEQIHPVVHPNNTNANLLPNCLRRRLRELLRYLQKENLFTKQAGLIVKLVVLSKLVRLGGANMLGVFSQKEILEIPLVSNLVNQYASSCLDDYANSRALPMVNRNPFGEDFEEEPEDEDERDANDEVDLKEILRSRSEDEWEDDDLEDRNGPELRGRPGNGNGLPYGGTNDLSKEIILGECIINKLVETETVIYLIQVLSNKDFYYPIPYWWVEPILYYYKEYREQLEGRK